MEATFLHTEKYETPCPNCKKYSFPISKENMSNYFNGKEIVCKICDAKHDWWTLLLRHFDWEVPSYLYAIVGGYTTSFMIKMKANEKTPLNLEEFGIPKASRILQISYTPNGKGLFPIEVHGNSPFRHFIPNKITLFGMPFGEPADETPVAIQICWFDSGQENEITENLVSSVEAFSLRKYNSCIIPSNVSVEATLSNLLTDYLNIYAGKDRVEDFLSNGATYSHQLNVVLNLISNYEKFPSLPAHIRGGLNELRGLRNQIAHTGKTKVELDKKNMSRLICSAAFGLSYLKLLEEQIKTNRK